MLNSIISKISESDNVIQDVLEIICPTGGTLKIVSEYYNATYSVAQTEQTNNTENTEQINNTNNTNYLNYTTKTESEENKKINIVVGEKVIGELETEVEPPEDVVQMFGWIIERKIVDEELRAVKAKSMSKAKGLLIANVSHELRTPLNALMGMLALLEDTELDDHQWSCIEIMRESSIDLMVLINDILDISKLEAGEMQLYPSSVSLKDVIESSHKIVGQLAYEKGIKLVYQFHKDVPDYVITDANRFKQMLKNLLSNAIKFTPSGSVTTNISIEPKNYVDDEIKTGKIYKLTEMDTPDKETDYAVKPVQKIDPRKIGKQYYIKFSITDTGIGISPEHIPKLFNSFTQVDSSNTKEYEGTGLGLAITSQLCKLMGGTIGVQSEKGKGSTFYFILPLQEYMPKLIPNYNMDLLKDKLFLVVDDDARNLMRITNLLEKWGVNFRECESSNRALISYINNSKYKFHLGLIDIVMPGINGNELAHKIASSNYPFPMIALSSASQQINSVSPAFSAHLNKPYEEHFLLETILSVLSDLKTDTKNEMETKKEIEKQPSKIEKLLSIKKISLPRMSKNTSTPALSVVVPSPSDNVRQSTKHKINKNFSEPVKNTGINILVVEDQQRNMQMIVQMLKSAGYKNISTASNGIEAIEKVKYNLGVKFSNTKSQYDVILMDIIMPKMDGIQASREISQLFLTAKHKPHIIAVTARITDDSKEEYRQAGIDDVLYKPIQNTSYLIDKLKLI